MSKQGAEIRSCPVCSANTSEVYLPETLGEMLPVLGAKWTPDIRKTFQMNRCLECGHVYAWPYLKNMCAHYIDNVDQEYLGRTDLRKLTGRKLLKKIRSYKPNGHLLDCGCATGDFLDVAKPFFNVKGVELSDWSRQIAEQYGFDVYAVPMDQLEHPTEFYDVITMWGFIEHLEEPAVEIKSAAKLLRPGGLVCLWTGDVDSISSRIFKSMWWYIQGGHLHLFTRHSLTNLMENHGFELVHGGTYPYVINLGYMATILDTYPVLRLFSPLLRTRLLRNIKVTLYIPGEIFAIYRRND